jgi:hypothetical protein
MYKAFLDMGATDSKAMPTVTQQPPATSPAATTTTLTFDEDEAEIMADHNNYLTAAAAAASPPAQPAPAQPAPAQPAPAPAPPCADTYELLEKCKASKKITRAEQVLTKCVSETDLLIQCMKKNPAHFLPMKVKDEMKKK